LQSIEFKAEINDGIIKIPKKYENFQNKFVLLKLTEQEDLRKTPLERIKENIQTLDFSKCEVTSFKDINPVDYQRTIRDAK